MRVLLTIVSLSLAGCMLDSEECGHKFRVSDGQCIPRIAPEPFGGSAPSTDAFVSDSSPVNELDISTDTADSTPPPDASVLSPFEGFNQILIVDRTEVADSRPTPALPGSDIDAVLFLNEQEETIGIGTRILDSQINDPFDTSIQTQARAAISEPDGRAVSLGPQGFIRVEMEIEDALQPRDQLLVVELEERSEDTDRYEVFFCTSDSEGLDGCRSLGDAGSGRSFFSLQGQ